VKVRYFSKIEQAEIFEKEMDIEACLNLLQTLSEPNSLLIVDISNAIQLDFHVGDDSFWVEIHEPQCLSAATVNLKVASEILLAAARNFDDLLARESLSALEIKWDYYCDM
jgi:hypothetical protein